MLLRIYAILPLSQFTKLTLILFMFKENKMKKFINDPFDFVEELTEGIIHAHPDYYRAENGDLRVIVRQDAPVKWEKFDSTQAGGVVISQYLWVTLVKVLLMALVSVTSFLLLRQVK